MDRLPNPAPFPVGTRVRYIGKARWYADAEMTKPLLVPGMEFTITEGRPGRQGTGRLIEVDEWTGEEIRDTTRDGWSAYVQANGHGRIASPESFEVVR